jgi:phosphoglycolate phosphatase
MRHQFQTILFDFDYTLADSSKGAVECINFALKSMGLPSAAPEAIYQTIGLSLNDTFVRLVGHASPAQRKEFPGLFAKRADEVMAALTVLFGTVPPAIRSLKNHGIKLGIVSTKFRYRIEGILRRDNLLDAFDVIIGGEDVRAHKPNPEGLQRAIERLNSLAEQTLYIGDSVIDAETAQRSATPFVAVLSGVTPREEFAHYPVVDIVENMSQLPEWLFSQRKSLLED